MSSKPTPELGPEWAISTVNLPGLTAGTWALVDPDLPRIRRLLAAGYLRIATLDESDELDARAGRGNG